MDALLPVLLVLALLACLVMMWRMMRSHPRGPGPLPRQRHGSPKQEIKGEKQRAERDQCDQSGRADAVEENRVTGGTQQLSRRELTPTRGHPIVAALLDLVMWPVRSVRADLIPMARGRVLEVGIGTGGNLPFYRNAESITGIDPDPHMLRRARTRANRLGIPVELLQEESEDLPFEDNSFGTVVATWVLCTVTDPERALGEIRRVLEPGGLLVYAEHTRSRFSLAARLQRLLTPIWKHFAAGCHLDRDTIDMIRRAGFTHVTEEAAGRERWTLAPVYRGTGRG